MKRVLPLLLALALGAPGCAGLASVLPAIMQTISIVQDATAILGLIDDGAKTYFTVTPNPDAQKQVTQRLTEARLALDTVSRLTSAGVDADRGQINAAFDAFRAAYAKLVGQLVAAGAMTREGTFAATARPHGAPIIRLPEPRALTYRMAE